MYYDASQIPAGSLVKGFDICIAGAGAAGIAMAHRLIGSTKRVLVLANGSPSDAGQPNPLLESIYQGTLGAFTKNVDPIFSTRSRLNMYGGTTNHFSFFAYPMAAADLLPRAGYRDASWPISIEELNRYYPDANQFGHYGPFNYQDLALWANALHGSPFPTQDGDSLTNLIWHGQPDPAVCQFQSQCGPALQAARNVTVLFNAFVQEIQTAAIPGRTVSGLACATMSSGSLGNRFSVEAAQYVLALGGIEPVRLLKISGNLGDNQKGMLGRGFMLHPLITNAAQVTWAKPVDQGYQNFYRYMQPVTVTAPPPPKVSDPPKPLFPDDLAGAYSLAAWGMLAATPETLAREKIGAFHSNVVFADDQTVNLSVNWESVPNENSRIDLDPSKTDPVFGQPVVSVNWNLMETEKRTIIRVLELEEEYFLAPARGASGFKITTDLSGGPEHWTFSANQSYLSGLQAGDHHMGALRMSKEPADGIVNPDCRLHTVANLYIAGSGVFPTSGHANPTLTILALALRLADHLK
jgi:choline dehydrogenase-like flavoprotein